MENEIWRDIKDFEGVYTVSNLGRVKTFHNRNGRGLSNVGKIMSLKTDRY